MEPGGEPGDASPVATSYDGNNRVTASNVKVAGQTYTFLYGYDLAGDLTSETYPSGRVLNTTFDIAARPATMTAQGAAAPYVQQVTYWPHGALYYWQYGNNIWPVEGYTAGLAPWYSYATVNNSPNSYLLSLATAWSNNNTVQQVTEGFGTGSSYGNLTFMYQNYTYDQFNRLLGVSDTNYARGFHYDEFGNMSVASNSGVTLSGLTPSSGNGMNPFSAATNRLVGTTYGYDARGDMTTAGAVTMTYDAEANQIGTSDTVNGLPVSISYIFDAEGQRVEKQTAGGATIVDVHDAFGRLAAEYNSAGVTPACTTCYLAYDGVGSVRLVTDQSGNVMARHDYLPFGEEIPEGTAGRNGNSFAATANIAQGFTGQESDGGTAELDYFNARHMAGVLGSFTQPDPMQAGADFVNPQSWNGYGYVLGNPLGLVDPSGMTEQGTVNGWGGDCDYSAEYAYPCYGIPVGGWGGWGGGGGGGAPSGGGGGGFPPPIGGVGTGSASAGGGMTGSLPPGSFPGGENLGLPPGFGIPSSFGLGLPSPYVFSLCSQFDPACGGPLSNSSGGIPAFAIYPILFSKALQHDNPNPTKGVQPVTDSNGKVIGWTLPGKGANKGKRVPKTLEWGKENGLDATDPKWLKAAILAGAGALTVSEILSWLAVGVLIF